MALPVGMTWLQYYNQQISLLVALRDISDPILDHKSWLSAAGLMAAKAAFNTQIANVKTALDDVNAAVQSL